MTDQLCETASGRTTHLITAAEHNPYSTTLTKLGLPNFPIGIEIVNVDWIGKCVEKKEMVSVKPYLVRPTPAPTPTTPAAPAKVQRSPVPMQRLTPVAAQIVSRAGAQGWQTYDFSDESSWVNTVVYNFSTGVCQALMKDGTRWELSYVPAQLIQKMARRNCSIGQEVSKQIRHLHPVLTQHLFTHYTRQKHVRTHL